MLKLIRKFFARQEKAEENVEFGKIDEWLGGMEKEALSELENEISILVISAKEEMELLRGHIETLRNAKLQNPNIPNRAKTMMEGNREAFLRKAVFLADSELDYKSIEEAREKCSLILKGIGELAESTQRSYAILNEFFARELSRVSQSISKIKKLMNDALERIDGSRLGKIKMLREELDAIKYGNERRLRLLENVESERKEIKKHEDIVAELEKEINEVKSGNEYMELESLLKQKEESMKKSKEAESRLIHDFSSIDKALKKYGKIAFENEKLIEEYIENPFSALLKDEKLEVIQVLSRMDRQLGRLEMDYRKKEKAVSKLKELDKMYFENARNECLLLSAESERIKSMLSKNKSRKYAEELEKELNSSKEKIEGIKRVISLMEDDISKLDEKKAVAELQASINLKLKENVVIV